YVDKGPTLSMTPPKDSNGNPNATVANYGTISTNPDANSSGYVFLIGPNVENWGSITAPQGQIGLIGSTGPVTLAQGNCGTNCVRPGLVVTMPDTSGGPATNGYDDAQSLPGKMNAAEGIIGMYGLLVQQNGIITATTAVRQNGQIELRATTGTGVNCPTGQNCKGIFTGPNSQITSDISDSSDTAESGFPFNGGVVNIGPMETINYTNQQVIQLAPPQYISLSGKITAPSGYVNINAGPPVDPTLQKVNTSKQSTVLLDSNSVIDVSGTLSTEPAQNILL